jgi:hypothetical protein
MDVEHHLRKDIEMSPELRRIVIATRQAELHAEAAAYRMARHSVTVEPSAPQGATRLGGFLRRLAGMPTFA